MLRIKEFLKEILKYRQELRENMPIEEILEKYGDRELELEWACNQGNDVYCYSQEEPALMVFYRMNKVKNFSKNMGTMQEILEREEILPYEVWIDGDCKYWNPGIWEYIKVKWHRHKEMLQNEKESQKDAEKDSKNSE